MNYKEFMIHHMTALNIENPCLSSKYRLKKINMLWNDYKKKKIHMYNICRLLKLLFYVLLVLLLV